MKAIAKRRIVKIGAPVARQVVEAVPDRRRAGAAEVDIGVKNALLLCIGHLANGPAIGTGNQ
ncbi:hypothetical protein D3C75_1365470 [compost metagenome]